jgi:hypothetical protein
MEKITNMISEPIVKPLPGSWIIRPPNQTTNASVPNKLKIMNATKAPRYLALLIAVDTTACKLFT